MLQSDVTSAFQSMHANPLEGARFLPFYRLNKSSCVTARGAPRSIPMSVAFAVQSGRGGGYPDLRPDWVPLPPWKKAWNQRPGYPLQKGPGTRRWEGTWNQRPGYSLWTDKETENITPPPILRMRVVIMNMNSRIILLASATSFRFFSECNTTFVASRFVPRRVSNYETAPSHL